MRIKLTENYFVEQITNAPHLWALYRKRTAKKLESNMKQQRLMD